MGWIHHSGNSFNFVMKPFASFCFVGRIQTCHFYAVKCWRIVFIICSRWLSFLCCQEPKKCIYQLIGRMVVIFTLPKAEEIYLIFCSWWLSLICCQELKNCISYLLRMVIIFKLPRAEDMYLLFAQDGCHLYATKNWRNFLFIQDGCLI